MVQTRAMKRRWAQRDRQLREQALANRIQQGFRVILVDIQRIPAELGVHFWEEWLDVVFKKRTPPTRTPKDLCFFRNDLKGVSFEMTGPQVEYNANLASGGPPEDGDHLEGVRLTTTEMVEIDCETQYIVADPARDAAYRALLDIKPQFEHFRGLWGQVLQTVCRRFRLVFIEPRQLETFYHDIAALEASGSLPKNGIQLRFTVDTFAADSLRVQMSRLNYFHNDVTIMRTSRQQLTRWAAALDTIKLPFDLELLISGPILDMDHLKATMSPHMRRADNVRFILEDEYATRGAVHWLMLVDFDSVDLDIFPKSHSLLAQPSTQCFFAVGAKLGKSFIAQLNWEIGRLNEKKAIFTEVEHMEEA